MEREIESMKILVMTNETYDRVKKILREGKGNIRVSYILLLTIPTVLSPHVKEKSIPNDFFPFWLIWTYPSQIF